MSQDKEVRDNKSYKTVTSNSVTDYTDRKEHSVSYDDGTIDTLLIVIVSDLENSEPSE